MIYTYFLSAIESTVHYRIATQSTSSLKHPSQAAVVATNKLTFLDNVVAYTFYTFVNFVTTTRTALSVRLIFYILMVRMVRKLVPPPK